MNSTVRNKLALLLFAIFAWSAVSEARAHCDALDGPVVRDAIAALAKRDVTPVLKWIRASDESEVREAFERTLVVREQGDEARELADRYFFETLVRLHRASEGEPYTGLKPAGIDPGPAVRGADLALETGNIDVLIRDLAVRLDRGVRMRFERARSTLADAETSVTAGREHVAAYVEFVHYAKRMLDAATSEAGQVHGQPDRSEGHQ